MTDTATLLANLKFYAGEASCHPDPNYFLEFEKLCTPSNILKLLSQLEAESQRAEALQSQLDYRNEVLTRAIRQREAAEASVGVLEGIIARKEFDALKGEQVPK